VMLISFAILALLAARLSDVWVDLFGESARASAAAHATSAAAPNPQEIFAQRSPGGRASGATASAKQLKQLKQIKAKPHERVLAEALPNHAVTPLAAPPIVGWQAMPLPERGFEPESLLIPAAYVPTPQLDGLGEGPPIGIPRAPIIYQGYPPPIFPPVITPASPIPPTSAVPEPTSWAMMLCGFAMLGWGLRCGRRSAVAG